MITQRDLAERWGVSHALIRQWRARGKLPEPDAMVGRQPVWNEETIRNEEDANGDTRPDRS